MWNQPAHCAWTALWAMWALQSLWCLMEVRRFRGRERRWAEKMRCTGWAQRAFEPRAVLIVPVKGADSHLHDHAEFFLSQRYRGGYRAVFVVESESDPAYGVLKDLESRPRCGVPVLVLVSGVAERGGQKVHNQLCALRRLLPEDEVVVFADIDIATGRHWLRHLVRPLAKEHVGGTTGYRWLIPSANLASRLASIINASVATLLGVPWRNHAWGGSMAIRRSVMEESKLLQLMDGALSDDYHLNARDCTKMR